MSRCSTSTPVSRLWTGRLETVASATASTPPDTTDVSADIRAVKLPVRFSDLSLPAVKADGRVKEHAWSVERKEKFMLFSDHIRSLKLA